jgi:hypothetical protein
LLYQQFVDSLSTVSSDLEIDLVGVRFARPHGVLAIVNLTRYWYEQGKGQTVLINLHPDLHAYLERINLFAVCEPYLATRRSVPEEYRLSRTTVSANLLELLPIRGDEPYIEVDCVQAIKRATYILKTWFPTYSMERHNLCNMLSEITENIKHSQDHGFALIQHYNGRGKSGKANEVVIAVSDLGIGIERSLSSKGLQPPIVEGTPPTAASYIQYAVHKYMSTHDIQGQRGLHRVQELVNAWRGRLMIRSCRSSVTWHKEGQTLRDDLAFLPGTQVTITVREPMANQLIAGT